MKPTEHIAKSAYTPKIGLFARLRGLLCAGGSGALSRRRVLSALSTLCVSAGCFLFMGASAYAYRTYGLFGSFGSEGSGNGQLEGPAGVALNESTEPLLDPEAGDVYVADAGNDRVQWFAPNLITKKYEYAGQFNGEQTPAKSFNMLAGIAIDNSTNPLDTSAGDVYVADSNEALLPLPGHDVVDKFSAGGVYEGQLTGICEKVGEAAPCSGSTLIPFLGTGGNARVLLGVAVNSEGDLFVDVQKGPLSLVYEFSYSGVFLGELNTSDNNEVSAIAAGSGEDIYVGVGVGNSEHAAKFDSTTGVEASTLDVGPYLSALAIDPANNDVFVDHGSNISEYGPFGEPYTEPLLTFPSGEGSTLAGSGGVAVNQAGTVFASQGGTDDVEVFNEIFPPTVAAEPVSKRTATGVTLNVTVNPEGRPITSCEFEYGTSASYGHIAECEPDAVKIGAGSGNVPVHANLDGLTYDTTYHYRLVVGNETGASETKNQEFTTRGPTIIAGGPSIVTETGASLLAKVDPNESITTYRFEYDTSPYTTSAPHGTSLPAPNASIGSGTSLVPVSVGVQGLQPGSTYYYRVVVESDIAGKIEAFDGPGQTLTTRAITSATPETCPNARLRSEQPYGLELPDCRAYEMVSPLDKDGAGVAAPQSRAALSGEAVTYLSEGSFSEAAGASLVSRYLARREPGHDRWSAQNISPPRIITNTETGSPFEMLLFTPELSAGVTSILHAPAVPGEKAGFSNLDLADLTASPVSYQSISNFGPAVETPYASGPLQEEGATPDLSHVVFRSGTKVYESAAGSLSQIDVPPTGTKFEDGNQIGAPPAARGGDVWHAVSANGERVFFTADGNGHNEQEGELGQLYVRENPGQPPVGGSECAVPGDACTVEVSASQRTNPVSHAPEPDPNGSQPAFYRDANAAGTRVFFTSRAELTNDANTGDSQICKGDETNPSGDCRGNLYEDDLETGVLSDLTAENPEGAGVLGLVTAGENAGEENSYVYFVANGVLASNENADKETARPGNCKDVPLRSLRGEHACNLYVAHYDGGKWETTFIAMLAGGKTSTAGGSDENDWLGYEGRLEDEGPGQHTVRVTPGGATLAFQSVRSLTGYANEPLQPGAGPETAVETHDRCTEHGLALDESGEEPAVPCREVYLYSATTGKLVCVSCDPSGARPVGAAELGGHGEDGFAASPSPLYLPRNLSENGARLFFQTPDPLVPHDSNGKVDVYEWEAQGEGSCTQAGGCVAPISDVAGDYESQFMDASASGDDVFIATAIQLVSSDTDTRVDVYDARVGGGFPVTPTLPVCDNGDSCKPPVFPQPGIFGAPASATFSGPGNATPALVPPSPTKITKTVRCKKGFTEKKNKCTKNKKKSKRAKRSAHTNRRAH